MGKKGGGMKLKRQLAPPFWEVNRKKPRFILKPRPGTHSARYSYPLGVVLRDILKKTSTNRETILVLNEGKIKVDGKVIRDTHHGVGLMDVVEISPSGETYRFVPQNGMPLHPLAIKKEEKDLKLLKITSKVLVKKGFTQYGFHDGKTLVSKEVYKVGDTCLVGLPEIVVKQHFELKKGAATVIIRGENAGSVGQIEEIKSGQFSLPKRSLISINERVVESPVSIVMAIGTGSSVIKVNG